MVWFFNKKKDQSNNQASNNQENKQTFTSKSYKKSYSKSKKCQTDPENPQYIICKSIIKDQKGTREEEERMPAKNAGSFYDNEQSSTSFSFFPFGSGSGFFSQDKNNMPVENPENTQTGQNNQGSQSKHFFTSYSTNKQCYTDPENNEYLICKSTIYDGKQKKQIEEKIKASDMNIFNLGKIGFGDQLGKFGNNVDEEIQHFMKDLNHGMNSIFPLFGPMMGFSFNNFMPRPNDTTSKQNSSTQTKTNNQNNRQKYNREHPTQYSHHYFSMHDQKRSQTRDL